MMNDEVGFGLVQIEMVSNKFCHGRVAVDAVRVPWPLVKNNAPKLLSE